MSGTDLVDLAVRAGLRPPRALTVAITGACNLRCRHCWVEAGRRTSAGHAPLGRVVGVVDGLAALGGDTLWISGGEPLSHPDWSTILAHGCSQPSLRAVGLQTNGVLLDHASVARLRALPAEKLHIQVSLDGASPRTHDRVRGKGSFAETMAGTARLVAAGLGGRTTIAFTEMDHNMEDVPALLELADRLGLAAVVGGTLLKDGSAARSALAPPAPAQYRALVSRYHADTRFHELYERYGRFSAVEWWKGRSGTRGDPCTFLDHPYVSAEGKMFPCRLCHADQFAASGVFDKPFEVVLGELIPKCRQLAQLARSRPATLPGCAACPVKVQCDGGCMGRAHASCGTLDGAEDRCELRKAVHACTPTGGCRGYPERCAASTG